MHNSYVLRLQISQLVHSNCNITEQILFKFFPGFKLFFHSSTYFVVKFSALRFQHTNFTIYTFNHYFNVYYLIGQLLYFSDNFTF